MALPAVIKQLKAWRHRNGLSQRAAVEVMVSLGFDVTRNTLQTWEQGYRKPGRFAARVLGDFLIKHPKIENPPVYKPGPK